MDKIIHICLQDHGQKNIDYYDIYLFISLHLSELEPQSAGLMLHLLKVWGCSEQDLGPSPVLAQLMFYIFHLIVCLYFIHRNKIYDSNH